MSVYLNDIVVCGEIINTTKNSVHGWLYLCDREVPLPLHLTGNCAPDLEGRHIRFEARRPHPAEDSLSIAEALASQQVGPAGIITADRKIRVLDDSEASEDAARRKRPKSGWKRCLYLEWFSQNGRVVVELVDPRIEYVEDQDDSDDEDAPTSATDQEEDADSDSLDELADEDDGDTLDTDFDEPDEDDDPYGLFSGEEGAVWRSSEEEDDAAGDDSFSGEMMARLADDDETMRELELMDSLIERGAEVPVGSIFDPPIQLPRPEGLDDQQVQTALLKLLAEMARYGIALDMCEHFSAREAYQLLLDEICVEEGAFPELRGTQWVQHFMTHDFCAVCQAEHDAEADDADGEDDDDDDGSNDDLPF